MVNTLAALVAAMTVGTVALMLLETAPIRPEVINLIAANDLPEVPIHQTNVPLQPMKWRNIVIHATGSEGGAIVDNCHFVVEQAPLASPRRATRVRVTELWKRQEHRAHITGFNSSFNENSIALCIVGDFSTRGPTSGQFREMIYLVRQLQLAFQITPGRVYLHRDLVGRSESPGRAFPSEQFNASLLRPSR